MTLILLDGGPVEWHQHVRDFEETGVKEAVFLTGPRAAYRARQPVEYVDTSVGRAVIFEYIGETPPTT